MIPSPPHWPTLWLAVALILNPVSIQGAEVSGFISDLASPDRNKRREAAFQLNQLGPEAAEAVPALIKALDDDEVQVFFHAVSALAKIGPQAEEAVPALIEGLNKNNRRYGQQKHVRCAFALSRIGNGAVDPLRKATREPDETLCANAIDTLAMMPPEMSAPALEEMFLLLGDEREQVSDSAAKALALHGKSIVAPLMEVLANDSSRVRQRDAIRTLGLIGKDAADSGSSIVRIAEGDDSSVLLAPALEALVRIRHDSTETTRLIVDALASGEPGLADAAANAALIHAQITRDLDTQPFALAMNAAPEQIQLRFARVLGRIGQRSAAAIPQLISATTNASTPENVDTFAQALAGIGAPAAPQLIAKAGEIPVQEFTDSNWIVKALSGIGNPALDSLREGLRSEKDGARTASVVALGLLGTEAKEAGEDLFATLNDSVAAVRGQSLVALSRIGISADRMFPLLEPLAKDPSPEVRAQTYRALGSLNDAQAKALPLLLDGLSDPDVAARTSAIDATGSLGGSARDAVPKLKSILEAIEGDSGEPLEKAVIVALGKIGPAAGDALPALVFRAQHPEAGIRELTLSSIALLGESGRPAKPEVIVALGDTNPGVRSKAIEALAAITDDSEQTTKLFVDALEDDSLLVRETAIKQISALGESAASAAPKLFALLETAEEPRAIIDALRNIRSRDPDLYIAVLGNKSPSVRLFACEALGRLGPRGRGALTALEKLKDDEYSFVRRRAIQAIERINRQR